MENQTLLFYGLILLGLGCVSLWLYIDNLKYELRNMTFDKEMYERLYELYKPQSPYPHNLKDEQ